MSQENARLKARVAELEGGLAVRDETISELKTELGEARLHTTLFKNAYVDEMKSVATLKSRLETQKEDTYDLACDIEIDELVY